MRLTANAVAAQQPTPRYLNRIRDLATRLKETVPAYSGICLPEFFDDQVTESILHKTVGEEGKLDIGILATTINELAELRAKDHEEKAEAVSKALEIKSEEFSLLKSSIIDGAIENNKNRMGLDNALLWLGLKWPLLVTLLFAGAGALLQQISGSIAPFLIILIPIFISLIEHLTSSEFIKKIIIGKLLPGVVKRFENRVNRNLRKAEKPYAFEIVESAIDETQIIRKCKVLLKQ